ADVACRDPTEPRPFAIHGDLHRRIVERLLDLGVRPVDRIFKAEERVVRMGPVRDSLEAPPWISRHASSAGHRFSPTSVAPG
ncbi:MAG TPA: hypothetical protein VMU02_03435, partial [bacterium]|nr:hypothetical protein [bacterium]